MTTNSYIISGRGKVKRVRDERRQRVILEAAVREGAAVKRQILQPNCLILILVVSPAGSMTMSMSSNCSVTQFPHLQNGKITVPT